jgi:hypothetical protein
MAAVALLMVFVMVRWSAAMIALARPREEGAIEPGMSPVSRWGLVYLLVWAALIAAFLWLLDALGSGDLSGNLLLMLLVAAGWVALNYLLILFARAIERANLRQQALTNVPADWQPAPEPEPPPEPVAMPSAPPAPRSKLRETLLTVRNLVLALLFIGIGEALPPMQRLHAWVAAHDGPILAVTITAGVIGFILFMGGVIHMVLTSGTPMSRREIEELSARNLNPQPALLKASGYRHYGPAVGAQAEESVTLAEVKAAWRARAWQVSPRWRRLFLIQIGVALLVIGLFGSLFVLAFPGLKLLLGGALVYAVVRTVIAFIRS